MVLMRHIIGAGEFPGEVRGEHRMRENAVKRGRSLSGVWEMGMEQRDGRHPRNEPRHNQQTQWRDLATYWTHEHLSANGAEAPHSDHVSIASPGKYLKEGMGHVYVHLSACLNG
jgi:hypothetical protein